MQPRARRPSQDIRVHQPRTAHRPRACRLHLASYGHFRGGRGREDAPAPRGNLARRGDAVPDGYRSVVALVGRARFGPHHPEPESSALSPSSVRRGCSGIGPSSRVHARRLLLRAILTPIKIAHFDDARCLRNRWLQELSCLPAAHRRAGEVDAAGHRQALRERGTSSTWSVRSSSSAPAREERLARTNSPRVAAPWSCWRRGTFTGARRCTGVRSR